MINVVVDGRDAVVAGLSCASCATEVSPTSKFCSECGAAVVPAPEPAEPEPLDTPPDAPDAGPSVTPPTETPAEPPRAKRHILRKVAAAVVSVVVVLAVLYCFGAWFVAQPYVVPSQAMAPTLNAGERIIVNKLTYRSYRLGSPKPGDVVVFEAPPKWNAGYEANRSDNTAVRWMQDALSVVGLYPPAKEHLIKRIIAVGGQIVQCRTETGLTVNGEQIAEPYLNPKTLGVEPSAEPCLGPEFGPVIVPRDRLWVMGDNRTHATDSRTYCTSVPADRQRGILCTGDAMAGTIPVENVIGKADRRF